MKQANSHNVNKLTLDVKSVNVISECCYVLFHTGVGNKRY